MLQPLACQSEACEVHQVLPVRIPEFEPQTVVDPRRAQSRDLRRRPKSCYNWSESDASKI
jgi:hypothetical protein